MLAKIVGVLYVFVTISCLTTTSTAERRLSQGFVPNKKAVSANLPDNKNKQPDLVLKKAGSVDLGKNKNSDDLLNPKLKRANDFDFSKDDKTFVRQKLQILDDKEVKNKPEVIQTEYFESEPIVFKMNVEPTKMIHNRNGYEFDYKPDLKKWVDKNGKEMLRSDNSPMSEDELMDYNGIVPQVFHFEETVVQHIEAPKMIYEEQTVVVNKAREPIETGNQEFNNARKMDFCLQPLVALFKPGLFTMGVEHRWVQGFKIYEDQPGIKTCYIEIEVKRPSICAFKTRAINIKESAGTKTYDLEYILRWDTVDPCTQFLKDDGYVMEVPSVNPVYKLAHKSGKDDLLDHQKVIYDQFLEVAKKANLFKNDKYKNLEFDSLSLKYGLDYYFNLVFKYNNKVCKIEDVKVDPYNHLFGLSADSPVDCKEVVNSKEDQKSFIPSRSGDWQREARDDFKKAIGELTDTNASAAVLNVESHKIKTVNDSSKEETSGISVEVSAGPKTCTLTKAKGNNKPWTASPSEAVCTGLLKGRVVRI